MDTTNLKEKSNLLIEHMKNAGYTKGYVRRFKLGIEQSLQSMSSDDVQCYADIYWQYEQTENSKWKLREKRSIVKALEVFDLYGKYPDGTRNSYLVPKDSSKALATLEDENEKQTPKKWKSDNNSSLANFCGIKPMAK
jgi:hypothetical protein